jgi:hypothetical protein
MGIGVVIILILVGFVFNSFMSDNRSFEVDNVLLKLSIEEGENLTKSIDVTNTNAVLEEFRIESNLDFISFDKTEFYLIPEKTQEVSINFDSEGLEPGVYTGLIKIIEKSKTIEIPVILEIETQEILFDSLINVPIQYSVVNPSGQLIVENKVFNLDNIGSEKVDVFYEVKDFEGNLIFSEKEDLVVETNILSNKIISIPENTNEGRYVFVVKIVYEGSIGTGSYVFDISNSERELNIESLAMWVVFIMFLVVIIFIIYSMRQRDKLLLELKKQHQRELRREHVMFHVKKKNLKKLSPTKKKIKLRAIMKKSLKKVKKINKIQKGRERVLKKMIKKKRKTSEVKRQLNKWKNEGYNVGEFAISRGGKKNKGDKTDKYKSQGYRV